MAEARASRPAQSQLREHPIQPIRPLRHVVEEQDRAGRGIERVRRAERRDQLRQRPANQHAAGLARPHGLEAIVVDLSNRRRQRHAAQKGVAVVARCSPREAAFDHRPVKRHQAAACISQISSDVLSL